MTIKRLLTATLMAAPALTQAESIALTYEMFEASVPHLDLETCPADLQESDVFCRASVHHDEIHVFAFHLDGDSPLIGFRTYALDGIESLLK